MKEFMYILTILCQRLKFVVGPTNFWQIDVL